MSASEQASPTQSRVFISYSHDNPEHCDRILDLAQQLRRDGINAELDQFHQEEVVHWPRWCEEQLRPENSDFVLCVCTPEYKRRVEGKVPADLGKGVFWEGTLIYNYLYDSKGNQRCVPALLDGHASEGDIPSILGGYTRFKLTTFDLEDAQSEYAKLYRLLTRQPLTAMAEVGTLQKLPPLAEEERRTDFMVLIQKAIASIKKTERNTEKILAILANPSQATGVFVTELPQDRNLVAYFWRQADVRFRFPADGWKNSTKAAEVGLGDMTLQHSSGRDAQIQIHVSILDDKYRDNWMEFETNTVGIWKGTISQFGPFSSREVFVDGRSAFRISGVIRGEVQGLKKIDLIYAPLGDNRLLEMHLTRNDDNQHVSDLERAFDLIISTIQFVRRRERGGVASIQKTEN